MIVVDIETTGIDCASNAILSIGAINFSNPRDTYYQECRISSGDAVTNEALGINGFTHEQIRDSSKETEKQLLNNFFKWLEQFEDQTIAGQNVDFDKNFINEKAKKYDLQNEIGKRIVDMHGITYLLHLKLALPIPLKNNFSNINTDSILQFVGLEKRVGFHNALDDARLEAETFSRLLYGKNLIKEYATLPIPKKLLNIRH